MKKSNDPAVDPNKGLREHLNSVLAQKRSLVVKRSETDKRLSELDKEIKELNAQLALSEPSVPTITDHALVRYMERRFGVNIEDIKREMLPDDPNMIRAINLLGSGNFPVGDSHRLVIKGNTVVSVLPPEGF